MSGVHTPAGLSIGAYNAPGGAVAVGGGSTIREIALADWPTRLTDYTWADGDLAYVSETKAFRKYDGTAAALVLPHLYGTIATLHESLSGAVVPGSAGWSEDGGTAWSADGTKATIATTGAGQGYATGSFASGTLCLAQGYWHASTRNNATLTQRFVGIENGSKNIYLCCDANGAIGFINTLTAVGVGGGSVASETWVEMYTDSTYAYAHQGVSADPVAMCLLSALLTTAGRNCYLGDASAVPATNTQTFRQWDFWSRS